MRRYTRARNPIERIRERWGLADAPDQAPPQHFIAGDAHPLPLVARGNPDPYFWPLPGYDRSVLDNPNLPSDSGAVDYNARQRSQLDTVPKGEVSEPISVYPAWESRLEGMRDFLPVLLPISDGEGGFNVGTPGTALLTSFVVPQGYTAFWKRFRFWLDSPPALLTPINTLITLIVDGVIVPHYYNLPLGAFMPSFVDTFIIASQGQQLSMRIEFTDPVGQVNMSNARALLYGNLRPRTGESEWRDVGVRMPEPPPPPVAVIAPPPPAPARPNPFLDRTAQPMPGTPARAFHHGRVDPNDRGGNRNPPAGRRR